MLSMSTLARRGLHPDSADGRHRRPSVPRVCGHSGRCHRRFSGGFAHHDSHDVREVPAPQHDRKHNFLYRLSERGFDIIHSAYARSLAFVLRHPQLTLVITLVTIADQRLSLHHRSEGLLSRSRTPGALAAPS